MKQNDLLKSLDFILNKGVCTMTIHRAWREFNKIKEYERRIKKLEELVAKESGYIFNKIGFV